ncbi:MAG TPA: hypothetical protein VIQ02_11355 [Jiangellaceae bacterium]
MNGTAVVVGGGILRERHGIPASGLQRLCAVGLGPRARAADPAAGPDVDAGRPGRPVVEPARAIRDGLITLIPTAALLRVTDDTLPGICRHGASRDRGKKRATKGVR